MVGRIMSVSLVALGVTLAAVGCGGSDPDRPKLGKVTGTVTYKGKPLTKGTVTFTPISGKGEGGDQIASGEIQSDGTYSLTTFDTDDGAVLGQHAVTVRSGEEIVSGKPATPGGPIEYKLPKSSIPKKYESVGSTPLKYTVEPGGKTIDLELKD